MQPLATIPENALDVTFPAPAYQEDFASIVANAGTGTDGFEDIFSVLASHADDAAGFLAGFDGDIGTLGGTVPSLGTELEADASKTLTDTIKSGQPSIDSLQQLAGSQGARVWPGWILTVLTAVGTIEFAPEVTIHVGLAALGNLLPFTIHAGQNPFPLHVVYKNVSGKPPLTPVAVTMEGGLPTFDRVWHDNFGSSFAGLDWNLYLDINPKKAGDFTATLTIRDAAGTDHKMIMHMHIAP